MTNYSIEDFWKKRLNVSRITRPIHVPGWSSDEHGLPTFKEAPLSLNADLSSDADPWTTPVIIVSAPGAVGKSTLAREISSKTGAIYLDLAQADAVGGNAISGGLVKSGIYNEWSLQSTSLLIDGLDEARLRVTQEAFEVFLKDIAQLSKDRRLPTVLFGRTGAAQDAWLILGEEGETAAVLEIGFYDASTAVDFAEAIVRSHRPNSPHAAVERHAVERLLDGLRSQTEVDGDRFAGYAPVLQAVAERVARDDNPSTLIAELERGSQPVTLQSVVTYILDRERGKLETLKFEDDFIKDKLYQPEEQLRRLVSRVFKLPQPEFIPMNPNDAQTYSSALETWVAEHPFLNGSDVPSSTVFDAVIVNQALKNSISTNAAVRRELDRGSAANPFLSEFFFKSQNSTGSNYIAPEQVGILYASLRARLSLGDSANLTIEAPEDSEGEDELWADVDISLSRRNSDRPTTIQFTTDQTGILRLGSYIEDVNLNVPHSHIEIGTTAGATLFAPVNIQCNKLSVVSEKLVVEGQHASLESAVYLEADEFEGRNISSVPSLRGKVTLAVSWPSSRAHPWTSFSTNPPTTSDPRIDEALRRFRKFVVAFRSHSKGSLARYQHKIEHSRMTKGVGRAVLDLLLNEEVLSLHGDMYHLDPIRLARVSGATYLNCVSRNFPEETIDFVSRALED